MDIANSKDWWKGRSQKPTTASGYELTRKHLGFKKKKKPKCFCIKFMGLSRAILTLKNKI